MTSDFNPIRQLEVRRRLSDGRQVFVGRLAQNRQGVFFQYDEAYCRQQHSLSPFQLPFDTRLHAAPPSPHKGLHGLFADSLPDGWGLMLMDRLFRQHGIPPHAVTAMDRLAFVGEHGMGALSYHPATELVDEDEADHWSRLGELGEQARRLFEGQTDTVFAALAQAGSSGGARPKVQVYLSPGTIDQASTRPRPELEPWLVKFTSSALALGHEEGLCEAAYLALARRAGIETPDWQLITPPAGSPALAWLALRRFDCNQQGRYHMSSACGLLDADFRLPSLDYADLIKAGQVLCGSPAVGRALFRRAIFNLFACNQDDHSKNWAFLLQNDGQWRPSPGYDLTFSPGPYDEHATAFMGHGKNPPRKVIQALADQAGFTRWSEARQVIEEVMTAVSAWNEVARALGVSAGTRREIAQRLDSLQKTHRGLWAE
ncbi:type II toxin-antitoxin system HipA family toxin [Halomonas marinisediminis]|uniref:Type II toxin-antitoxin system HipA family toxin n=1 Tax=Halomonas marinisediminis TaxID=2546095 RepID=A0ABY2DBG8_9GAMM|nr:type II toxin-antitoxin system HipA family toxin [Halomonas marinisediminis]TDB05415.1 type II toxin-antitoxin system HipA family toxin [Halomonas marinisediminis]